MRILTINPGSTSTKIAVFENTKQLFLKNIKHSVEELAPYEKIIDQYDFRKDIIVKELVDAGFDIKNFPAVVGRGGLLKPIAGGVYRVNDAMLKDLQESSMGEHASNLGGVIALEIAKDAGENTESFIVDPVVVDEMDEVARLSGMPELPRVSIFHALNQKAVARRYAEESDQNYNELSLIVVHMGGGVSVGAHKNGRVIDVNNALDGDGAFSPERSGGVPSGQLARLCFSGKYTLPEIQLMLKGKGGLVAYLGTNDAYEVEMRVKDGDKEADLVYRAMAYQISKDVGAMAAVLEGKVDQIILTGGVAYDKGFVTWLKQRMSFISDITVYPGEDEMKALAKGGYMAIKGTLEVKEYI